MTPHTSPQMRNPGVQAGVSDDQLGGWSFSRSTPTCLQAQILACRFGLQQPTALAVARLCFGEGCGND